MTEQPPAQSERWIQGKRGLQRETYETPQDSAQSDYNDPTHAGRRAGEFDSTENEACEHNPGCEHRNTATIQSTENEATNLGGGPGITDGSDEATASERLRGTAVPAPSSPERDSTENEALKEAMKADSTTVEQDNLIAKHSKPPAKSERPYINEDGDTVIPPGWKEVPDAAGSTEGVENEARRLAEIETAYRQYGWPGAEREIRAALSDTEAKLEAVRAAEPTVGGMIEEIERLEGVAEALRKKANENRIEADNAARDYEDLEGVVHWALAQMRKNGARLPAEEVLAALVESVEGAGPRAALTRSNDEEAE